MDPAKIQGIEKQLGYTFTDKNELLRALTHPTFSKEQKEKPVGAHVCPHQSVYATLGDAVLKAGFISLLMDKGLKTKGDITISKADLENNLQLAEVGRRLHLLEENFIQHRAGSGEKLEEASRTLYSDTVEALIGAIYLDSNSSMSEVKKCISKIFKPELEAMDRKLK
ncbi:ribonuclease III domain-containing protein [Methanoregula sp.]|uniref:ribonuclease III domain-containing protein n=1 Tax=Methanoregula sp. TaxID=2052170 RepID=UPI00260B3B9C|nr:ribonuclease III domain-containing protein [Methanoregula sp.]MDD5142670.1 ribonuclease III domain-containing protein [Methanoregula sp.]